MGAVVIGAIPPWFWVSFWLVVTPGVFVGCCWLVEVGSVVLGCGALEQPMRTRPVARMARRFMPIA